MLRNMLHLNPIVTTQALICLSHKSAYNALSAGNKQAALHQIRTRIPRRSRCVRSAQPGS